MPSNNNPIASKVGATISGVTNTFTVTNPSNTASSAARETIVVGGGTAGDPTLNWNVSGVTNWEMGIDNSVSDNLTISQGTALGTNDTWRMNTSGYRTIPLQPRFMATRSANLANVTGDGTVYTAIFDNVITNISASYNNATGIFTAPITGFYFFSAGVSTVGGAPSFTSAGVYLVTTSNGVLGQNQNFSTVPNSGGGMNMLVSAFIPLTAGDTAKIAFNVAGGAKTVTFGGGQPIFTSWSSFFTGALIC